MRRFLRVLAALALIVGAASSAAAATITIVNQDGPNEGFNDPTPVAPVGGNPLTTRGAQALYVFQYAADIWGALLPSNVQIRIEANFDPQTCDASSGVLGSAGPNSLHADFPNAPYPATLYHQALANRLAGFDLDPSNDIGITFNSAIGGPNCLPQGWYFGVDGNEGPKIELLPVVLHEMGHGLGFSTSTLAGVQIEGLPHVYDRFLYDATLGAHWHEMTEGERIASAQNCQKLGWDGPHVMATAPRVLGPKPILRATAPATVAGDYEVGLAAFGARLSTTAVSGPVVLGIDGFPLVNNGCEPLINAADVAGKIVLLDRGGCPFVLKAKIAQNAGAIALIVADSTAGCPPAGMSGVDPTVTIPTVRVTQDVGVRLKSALLAGLEVSLLADPALRAGADGAGRVLVYTPTPFALGSSVSHWDTSAEPNLLMEPALNPQLSSQVDLAQAHFADIGWYTGVTGVGDGADVAVARLASVTPNPTADVSTLAFRLAREVAVELAIHDLAGRRVRTLVQGAMGAGVHLARWDGRDESGRAVAPGVYLARLVTPEGSDRRTVVRLQ